MFNKLFRRTARGATRAAARLDEGLRIYAIGDVHGRVDLLQELMRRIDADLRRAPSARALTVFLGDYVDRGLESSGVVDLLTAGRWPTEIVALRGNHEETMLAFLQDAAVLERWRHFGGLEALHSYGVDVREAMKGGGFEKIQTEFANRLPPAHRRFLEDTRSSVAFGDYFFCHAGVRPNVPLDRQSDQDLLWIREEFLGHSGSFGKVVVHGHTPVAAPENLRNRINVDTGAYLTGVLTALRLEGASRDFILTA